MPLLGFRVANVIHLIRHFFHLEMNELASCRLLGVAPLIGAMTTCNQLNYFSDPPTALFSNGTTSKR